ncbi:DUF2812 domain-containing protein [Cellulosilyticum sp. I15G10I2]|uniref:DUF2812 domain-containing protein n=1 Tax=Cellulosilyticum sp. I15G10I2 TaxID=1892843 RepID=UPI00085CA350|nr:DUF2812 domain-containing protein [Cellulosilyticum sp. I15G10I2]
MKRIKRSFRLYAAWEYEKEEEDLNAASQRGWQLAKGGCFSSTFYKDESVRYIYQLDYRPHNIDMDRYKETFEEQGWTYINSTFNGWHYFCKLYKEGECIEDYKIYTDRESLYEMQNRWVGLVTTCFFLYLVFAGIHVVHFIRSKEVSLLIQAIAFILLTITFGLGVYNLRRRRKGLKSGMGLPIQIILPLAIVLLISAMNLIGAERHHLIYHTNFTYINKPEDTFTRLSDTLVIEEKGTYKIDLDIAASDGQMQVIIEDFNGNEVFDVTADRCTVNNHKLVMEAGTYDIYFQYLAPNYSIDTSQLSINIKLKR